MTLREEQRYDFKHELCNKADHPWHRNFALPASSGIPEIRLLKTSKAQNYGHLCKWIESNNVAYQNYSSFYIDNIEDIKKNELGAFEKCFSKIIT
uniref:Uncharacterized protein n=1 Tax=Romanomermis culicivorax TaxID=13658 RepID=A0A915KPY9_ROMCU